MDLVLKRRIVYTGLRPFFDDEAILSMVTVWDEKYAAQPNFAFVNFLTEVCRRKEDRALRADMLTALFQAMELPEKALLPDPLVALKNVILQAGVNEVDAKTKVLFSLVHVLMAKMDQAELKRVKDAVFLGINQLATDERRKHHLHHWLEHMDEPFPMTLDKANMRALLNLVYVGMCDAIGPIKADQLLAKAIQAITPMAKTHQVNIVDFL